MCGIIGAVGNVTKELMEMSLNSIGHRGPDNASYFLDKNIALGHTRLSIQDLSSNGNQPMHSEDGRYCIIFNGEIYNHFEIRKNLKGTYSYRSSSDTETLLYALAESGTTILNSLNGIFSFAFFDKISGDLLIVRDQFGVKPLYYYQDSNIFLFGSEIKSFLHYKGIEKSIDYTSLVSYINFLWCPGEATPFKKVRKLKPGHYIKINTKNVISINPVKYYDIPFNGKYSSKTESELIEELEKRLLKAVDRQLLSDVPVAFFLSGGLDSSAMVALTRKLYPQRKIQCFTIETEKMDMREGFSDDLYYAEKVAAYLKADLEIVKAKVDITKDFDKMVWHLDEPQADPAPLHVLNISKRAKEMGYKVLIGGTAGDDLFSGYRRHQALQMEKYFKFIPSFLGKAARFFIGMGNVKNPNIRRVRKLVENIDKGKVERLISYYSWLPLKINKNLFGSSIKEKIKNFDPGEYLQELLLNIPSEKSDLNKMLYWELKSFLVDHNLNYTDKMSMATGVEVRVPFLDKELVEFSTCIPPELKLKGTTTKYLFKKVMEKYLPLEVIYRPKAGFGAPVRQWITDDLEEKINDYLSPDLIKKRGIFDSEKVWQLIKDNKSGIIDASYPIWCLLAIESWFRQFVDGENSN